MRESRFESWMVFLGIERKNATAGRCKRPRGRALGQLCYTYVHRANAGPRLFTPLPGLQYMDCIRQANPAYFLFLLALPSGRGCRRHQKGT